ncbi:MAG: response regulator [Thermodesulfobacteriota bacterium]|nr:response regulator [Thermodesulfobacteriota bacterium]
MPKILFVDDEVSFLNSAIRHFRKSDYEIVTAENGVVALELLEESKFDLVVLDQMMPKMDGLTTFEEIKKRDPTLPVIMSTAHGTIQLAVEFMKDKSAVYFFPKPIDFNILELKIQEVLTIAENEKKLRESEIFNAMLKESLKVIQTLACRIVHDFNNVLTEIKGSVDMLELKLSDDKNVEKYTQHTQDAIQRMTELISQLLIYAQERRLHMEVILLQAFLEDLLSFILRDIDPAICVERDFMDTDVRVNADFVQLEMVISGVITNAIDAIEGSGLIKIKTRTKEIDKEFVKYYPHLNDGRYVCITIEDNGKGMDKETRERLFDPLYTTKYKGTGLGMSTAYNIVRNHQGWIAVDSELDKGTIMDIYLPILEMH